MHADDAASQLTVLLLRGSFLGLLLAVVTWTASGRARPVVSFISSQTIGSRLSTAVLVGPARPFHAAPLPSLADPSAPISTVTHTKHSAGWTGGRRAVGPPDPRVLWHDIYAATCSEQTSRRWEGFDDLLGRIRSGDAWDLDDELQFLKEHCPDTFALVSQMIVDQSNVLVRTWVPDFPDAFANPGVAAAAHQAALRAALAAALYRTPLALDDLADQPLAAPNPTLPPAWAAHFGAGPLLWDWTDGGAAVAAHCLRRLAPGTERPVQTGTARYAEYHWNDDSVLLDLVNTRVARWTAEKGLGRPAGVGRPSAELYLREYAVGGAAGLHNDVAEAVVRNGELGMVKDEHDTGHFTALFYVGVGEWRPPPAGAGPRVWRDFSEAERWAAGGETVFPLAPGWPAVDPRPGTVLFFSSYGPDRRPSLEALHLTRVLHRGTRLVLVVDFSVTGSAD